MARMQLNRDTDTVRPNLPATPARYRVGQFFQGFVAHVTPAELELAAELLGPRAWPLFAAMPTDAQRHSFNVLYDVQTAGFHDVDLAVAALLHDSGKIYQAHNGAPPATLGLWWRGPLVILEAIAPHWLERWATPTPAPTWRHLLHRHLHHPALGAQAARAAGCSEMVCRLIAQHQTPRPRTGSPRFLELLHVLQWADSRN